MTKKKKKKYIPPLLMVDENFEMILDGPLSGSFMGIRACKWRNGSHLWPTVNNNNSAIDNPITYSILYPVA